jgi:hypothetical protein
MCEDTNGLWASKCRTCYTTIQPGADTTWTQNETRGKTRQEDSIALGFTVLNRGSSAAAKCPARSCTCRKSILISRSLSLCALSLSLSHAARARSPDAIQERARASPAFPATDRRRTSEAVLVRGARDTSGGRRHERTHGCARYTCCEEVGSSFCHHDCITRRAPADQAAPAVPSAGLAPPKSPLKEVQMPLGGAGLLLSCGTSAGGSLIGGNG